MVETDDTPTTTLAPAPSGAPAPEPNLLLDGIEFEDAGVTVERRIWIQILAAGQAGKGEPAFEVECAVFSAPEYAELTRKFERKKEKVARTGKAADWQIDQIDAEFERAYCERIGRNWRGATLGNLEGLWSGQVPKRTPEYEAAKARRAEIRFSTEMFLKLHHYSWAPSFRNIIFNRLTEVSEADLAKEAAAKKL